MLIGYEVEPMQVWISFQLTWFLTLQTLKPAPLKALERCWVTSLQDLALIAWKDYCYCNLYIMGIWLNCEVWYWQFQTSIHSKCIIFLNAFRERRQKYMPIIAGKKLAREHSCGTKFSADCILQQLNALLLLLWLF